MQTMDAFQFVPTDCVSCGGTVSYIFEDDAFNKTKAHIPLALGKDVYGRTIVGDGFGVPLIVRYVLENCRNTNDAAEQKYQVAEAKLSELFGKADANTTAAVASADHGVGTHALSVRVASSPSIRISPPTRARRRSGTAS